MTVFRVSLPGEVRCSCTNGHLRPGIMICWQRWKLTNTSVRRDKGKGDKKRASETGKANIQKMIMKEMMSQLRVDTVHFLQLPTGESSTQCAPPFICRQRSVLMMLKIGFFIFYSLPRLGKTQDKRAFVAACLTVWFIAIINTS